MSLAREIYEGSNGAATRVFLTRVGRIGPRGRLAAALFRAQKASERAKRYRGSVRINGQRANYRELAYQRKGNALAVVCDVLCALNGDEIRWGWGRDEVQLECPWVLYVELPTGQVSFHSPHRYAGPEYTSPWDGVRGVSPERILAFCDQVCREGERSIFIDGELSQVKGV